MLRLPGACVGDGTGEGVSLELLRDGERLDTAARTTADP
jgi:hypothetical protein